MSLYPDQIKAAEDFERAMNETGETFMGLWASAGYGKSYSTKHMIEEVVLKHTNYTPIMTSTTHSAVSVAADFTGMACQTIHSLMKWVPTVDKDTGEEGLSTPEMRGQDPIEFPDYLLVCIDEAGMLGHDEVALLEEAAKQNPTMRFLFIGDHKQCFPVFKKGQRECVPAHEATEVVFELTTPKRTTADNMIFAMAQVMRDSVDGGRWPNLITKLNADGKTGVRTCDDIEEMAVPAFKAGLRDNDVRSTKILAYTNDRCLALNRKIRNKILGYKSQIPVVGEEMVANVAIGDATNENVIIRNNQLLTVKSVEETESYGMPGAYVEYIDEDGEDIPEAVFVPESPTKLKSRLDKLKTEARILANKGYSDEASEKWRTFYSLKEGVADIRYTYAMTVNKSQGVTLKHALVDFFDINRCQSREQKARMAYTAMTRPTTYLTIEGELTG